MPKRRSPLPNRSPLIVALDFPALAPAMQMAVRLAGPAGKFPGLFKIGSELFTAIGPASVVMLEKLCAGIFLDLKFHDIPNTVAGAVRSAAALPGVRLINVHALGGLEMMQAAAEALRNSPVGALLVHPELARGKRGAAPAANRPKLLAVTILTSMDAAALRSAGIAGPPAKRVVALAKLAQRAGCDGVVCSPLEVRAIRRACGPKFLTVVPGIRPDPEAARRLKGAAQSASPSLSSRAKRRTSLKAQKKDDQSRIATPAEAIRAGADYIVVGRPITAAPDPRAAAQSILSEISSAL